MQQDLNGREIAEGDGLEAVDIPVREVWTSRTVQSVERAFDILELLAESESGTQLRQIAEKTGFNVSTCHHLVSTLVKRGYARKSNRDRSYNLGNKLHEVASRRLIHFDVLEIAMPELRRLHKATGETVRLYVMHGCKLTSLAEIPSGNSLTEMKANDGRAAHATAAGKAILAWLPETEIAKVIAEQGLARFTDRTILKLADLLEELRLVRRNGFAVEVGEFQPGVSNVAAAIRNQYGAVIGSVSCSTPEALERSEAFRSACDSVRETASTLSKLLESPKDRSGRPGVAA
ncbi:MAG: IclR family transcriptional regulator [Albidovulum sp.]|nr:IclR family transcriptional regulator [Albidovulum sp.]